MEQIPSPEIRVNLLVGITDIDDKIINRANVSGRAFTEVASHYEKDFINMLVKFSVQKTKA